MVRWFGLGLFVLLSMVMGWSGFVSCGSVTGQQEGSKESDVATETSVTTEPVGKDAGLDASGPADERPSEGLAEQSLQDEPAVAEKTPESKPEAVDPGPNGKWSDGAKLPEPQQETAVLAFHGEVYVIGGINGSIQTMDKVLVYNPSEKKWRTAAPLPKVMHHANAAVYNGKIYVLGSLNPTFGAEDGVYEYDPKANKWTTKKPMPRARRRGASAVGTIGDTIYVMGGLRRTALVECDAYNPKTDEWTQLPDLPVRLDHMAAGVIDGKLYVAGGRDTGITTFVTKSFSFDPATKKWAEIAPLPTLRGGVAAAVHRGKLYIIGGEGNPTSGSNGVFAQVEVYDPKTNQWTKLTPMPKPVHGTGAATIGDVIYIPGGATRQAFGATDIHAEYLPPR